MEWIQGKLTARDKGVLRRELDLRRQETREMLVRGPLFLLVFFGILAFLTILASDVPVLWIIGIWVVIFVIFSVWMGVGELLSLRKDEKRIHGNMTCDYCRRLRVEALRYWLVTTNPKMQMPFYLFEGTDGKIAAFVGWDFSPTEQFPTLKFEYMQYFKGENESFLMELFGEFQFEGRLPKARGLKTLISSEGSKS